MKQQPATIKALLRAQDAITHAISNLVDADNEINKVVRVLELPKQK